MPKDMSRSSNQKPPVSKKRKKTGAQTVFPPEQKQRIKEKMAQLGFTFEAEHLLLQAFTHSSYVNEHRIRSVQDNERLEFLGDAVVELAVSRYLFTHFPDMSEGEMTKLRAAAVCEPSLSKLAKEQGFGELVFIGKGEEMTGGRLRPALLADVYESFLGALYLDQGMEQAQLFLNESMFTKLKNGAFSHMMDFKSQLQETIQKENGGTLLYEIQDERGPAHSREFFAVLKLDNTVLGEGTGRSKKEAEQQAAENALKYLEQNHGNNPG